MCAIFFEEVHIEVGFCFISEVSEMEETAAKSM